jgi:hypothetical protein
VKWFQVDSDTPNDPKIRALIRTLGNEGMGALFRLWCHIANHGARPGWSVDTAGRPIPVDELVEATGLERPEFDQLVLNSVQLGHFKKLPWEKRNVIAIPAMERRADTYTKRTVRSGVEHTSNNGRRVFDNKTVQHSTNKVPPKPPFKGGRSTRRRGGASALPDVPFECPHDPKCLGRNDCHLKQELGR